MNHTSRSAMAPSRRTGLFASLSLLRARGSGAPSSGGVGGRTSSLRLTGHLASLALAAAALLALAAPTNVRLRLLALVQLLSLAPIITGNLAQSLRFTGAENIRFRLLARLRLTALAVDNLVPA